MGVKNGSAKVTLFYTYDTFDENIPLKEHSSDVDQLLSSFNEQLSKYKELQTDLGIQEKHSFLYTERLENKIFKITIFEIGVIIFSFIIEIIVLNRYLKNKELI